jgi:hypothetical protein
VVGATVVVVVGVTDWPPPEDVAVDVVVTDPAPVVVVVVDVEEVEGDVTVVVVAACETVVVAKNATRPALRLRPPSKTLCVVVRTRANRRSRCAGVRGDGTMTLPFT